MVTLKYGMIPLKLPLTPVVFELFHVYLALHSNFSVLLFHILFWGLKW